MKIKSDRGFGAVEVIVLLLIISLVGGVGYYVGTHKSTSSTESASNSSPTSTKTNSSVVDPYKGWKSYTLKYEKLSFKYPSDWTLTDNSDGAGLPPSTDSITLSAQGGFSFYISDGIAAQGDPIPLDSANAASIKFAGSNAYMVFTRPRLAQTTEEQNSVRGFVLLKDPSDLYSWPVDRHANGDPNINNGGSRMLISASYSNDKLSSSTASALQDTQYKNSKLVIESMRY